MAQQSIGARTRRDLELTVKDGIVGVYVVADMYSSFLATVRPPKPSPTSSIVAHSEQVTVVKNEPVRPLPIAKFELETFENNLDSTNALTFFLHQMRARHGVQEHFSLLLNVAISAALNFRTNTRRRARAS